MATNKTPWESRTKIQNGVMTVTLAHWERLTPILRDNIDHMDHYVWRGQSNFEDRLEPKLYRTFREMGVTDPVVQEELCVQHLRQFKETTLGRRGPTPPRLKDLIPLEIWALGRHHGLDTPLLDWTESPYVALYFAFSGNCDGPDRFRGLYALDEHETNRKNLDLSVVRAPRTSREDDNLYMVRPLLDENRRLVTQSGLFTYLAIGQDVESWVQEYFKDSKAPVLIKFKIENCAPIDCLRDLHRMNINHKSLFPDLYGAAEFSNMMLRVYGY